MKTLNNICLKVLVNADLYLESKTVGDELGLSMSALCRIALIEKVSACANHSPLPSRRNRPDFGHKKHISLPRKVQRPTSFHLRQ
jgi:antitoxin component of RelBE/YafQ-DinJ toxin-antitoxin module